MDRIGNIAECETEILERIRRAAYVRLIDDWYRTHDLDPSTIGDMDRKVLRRLLIANDIYHFSQSEHPDLPPGLHTDSLELPDDLLLYSPKDWKIADIIREYTPAANAIDSEIERVSSNPALAKRFTALVLGYWLTRCDPQNPRNLVVIDNLDQQPTDHIEQIVNQLLDLDPHRRGLRLLVPLRPSSIVPHGFTANIGYMYHYGPNCFDMIYRRLSKNVLLRDRAALTKLLRPRRATATAPTREELTLFYVATYLYALICINGQREALAGADDVRPNVHSSEANLHNIRLGGAGIQQLADTLEAIVGTCGRYATDQLRRYYDHVYRHAAFLRQIETSGLERGAAPRLSLPYGQVVSAILGPPEAELGTNVTGLANLYSAIEPRANPDLPSLAKLRILIALAGRQRRRVRNVLAVLAQYGIPAEVTVEALNYLHAKKRLLLWFSRNADLSLQEVDLEQYVVISEHGIAYLKDLVGDFEYVWFCAQQLVARATADGRHYFISRLQDYRRLLGDFARTEWKQMTFRRLAAGGAAIMPDGVVRGEEMLTLFVLYSSFERALRGAAIAVGKQDTDYINEVADVIDALSEIISKAQADYELYYGHTGYLAAYARKIERCLPEVRRMSGNPQFRRISSKLVSIAASWARPPTAVVHDEKGDDDDDIWLRFTEGLPSATEVAEEHAKASMDAKLRTFLDHRKRLRGHLGGGFSHFSWLDTELLLLIAEGDLLYDVANRLAAYTGPFLRWLGIENDALKALQQSFATNRYVVPDVVTMEQMDEFKNRANALSITYVSLAQRLGASPSEHLSVRWSV